MQPDRGSRKSNLALPNITVLLVPPYSMTWHGQLGWDLCPQKMLSKGKKQIHRQPFVIHMKSRIHFATFMGTLRKIALLLLFTELKLTYNIG